MVAIMQQQTQQAQQKKWNLIFWYHIEGLTLQQIGTKLGISRQRVHQLMRKYEISTRSRGECHRPKVSRDDLLKALEQDAMPDGKPRKSHVASLIGMTRETLNKYCDLYDIGEGVEWVTNQWIKIDIELAIEWYERGLGLVDIGHIFGVDAMTIHRRFVQNGIARRPVGTRGKRIS